MAASAETSARLAAAAALDKRAHDLVVLDLQGLSTVADYFVVMSARSGPQAETIADAVHQALKLRGVRLRHREGTSESGWLLMDYGDVVVHVFLEATRAFYALERLWGDAPTLALDAGRASTSVARAPAD